MKQKIYPWLIVLCCCLFVSAQAGYGVTCAGLFFAPVAEEFGSRIGDVSLSLTIMNLTAGLMGPVAVKLFQRHDMRRILLIAGALSASLYASLSFATALWQLYLLNFLIGVCSAAYGMIAVNMIIGHWFHRRMGVALGIPLSFGGISGSFFSPLITSVIAARGWRFGYLFSGGLVAVLILPTLLVMRSRPSQAGLLPYGADEEAMKDEPEEDPVLDLRSAVREPLFWMVCVVSVVSSCVTACSGHLSNFGVSVGLDVHTAAYLVSAMMVGNALSKISSGFLCDSIGAKRTASSAFAAVAVSLVFLAVLPGTLFPLLLAAAFGAGLIFGNCGVGLSAISRDAFGRRMFSSYFSYIAVTGYASHSISTALIGYTYDAAGSYSPAFLFIAALCAAAFFCVLSIYRRKIPIHQD